MLAQNKMASETQRKEMGKKGNKKCEGITCVSKNMKENKKWVSSDLKQQTRGEEIIINRFHFLTSLPPFKVSNLIKRKEHEISGLGLN